MIISIKDDQNEFGNFLSKQMQVMIPENDFLQLLMSFDTSIKKLAPVDLELTTLTDKFKQLNGTLLDVKLIINDSINNINIKIVFLKNDNSLICFECDNVGSSTVIENRNSVPGTFMKYYINNINHSVKIALVFHNI
ncbi:hypothetical protein [Clostridium diolis]|uniref:hypothetical protein n=1 Tax=Clostridium diolis TaxID=223919 RepID=UPI003AF7D820